MNGYATQNMAWDENGQPYAVDVVIPYWELDAAGVAVTLLVVKGVLTLEEGANILHLAQDHLVAEAEAWSVAGSI
jgi:hypothetical protein